MPSYTILTYLSMVATTFLWGGTFTAGRILGHTLEPTVSAFLRFAIATITLILIQRLRYGHVPKPKTAQILPLASLGFTGIFAYNIFFFGGLQHIHAGRAALIIAATPIVIACFASLFFKEKLTPIRISGILLSFIAALYVISNGHLSEVFSGGFGAGEQAMVGCVLAWSAYTLLGRKVLGKISPLTSVTYACLFGTLMLLPLALKDGLWHSLFSLSWNEFLALAYLGIGGSAIGFWWYYEAIKKLGASKTAIFINLVPVFALLLSHFILGESVKFSVLIGGVFILIGVALTNQKR